GLRERHTNDRIGLDVQRQDAVCSLEPNAVGEALDLSRRSLTLQKGCGDRDQNSVHCLLVILPHWLMRPTDRNEWKFFAALPKADPVLAAAWWSVLVARGLLGPAVGIAMGVLVAAVTRGASLGWPLAIVAAAFVLLQVLPPIQQAISANLGDRLASWLYEKLTLACVRPPGMRHLEDPALTSDL